MKIGDEVYVHGYVDEIRYDDAKRVNTIIIRNDGGYFGTVEAEIHGIAKDTDDEIDTQTFVREMRRLLDVWHLPQTEQGTDCTEVEQTDCSWGRDI